MFAVEYAVHVFVPLYNAEAFAVEAVESALRQTYARARVWVYDDGSTDTTAALLRMKFRSESRVTILTNKRNLGPAQTKWLGFQAIAKEATPNDIVLVLDGDDYLVTDEALAIVHAEYLTRKCWFTYGSYVGPFSKEVKALDANTHKNFRAAAWRYGHPRTFKAFLINHLTDADFQQADGTWLTKGTDRGFILRFLELSGPSCIAYIRSPLYFYRKHARNTWSVSEGSRARAR
ncbi:nucleotide-diphospho-sugar transferase [Tribonema minus]|uniref:Nucleotide-diphospho-sugar transferase n=1 Tax=Tribonema minus TaxID=303371 RepID=A0A835YIF7_9STRA|nr:nucleotide-diphospho-sugar transferase [Tribonema minus]